MIKGIRPLLIFSFSVLCANALGWGSTGHRTTGLVAQKYLNKKAEKALEFLLNGQSLAMASTWMDEVRSDTAYEYLTDWHWVTIPAGKTYDQSIKNPNGDIIKAIEETIATLKSRTLTREKEIMRVRILIHLLGDIHQPLHAGMRDDKGGNDVKVMWFRNESNLHKVLDSDMIDENRLSYTEFAASLDRPAESQLKKWQVINIREWAKEESQSYDKQVYNIGNGKLGFKYTYENFHIVRLRLLQAGVRIATILNDIYGK